jgi:hypothetical protein
VVILRCLQALQGTVEDLREELKRVKAEMSARGSK